MTSIDHHILVAFNPTDDSHIITSDWPIPTPMPHHFHLLHSTFLLQTLNQLINITIQLFTRPAFQLAIIRVAEVRAYLTHMAQSGPISDHVFEGRSVGRGLGGYGLSFQGQDRQGESQQRKQVPSVIAGADDQVIAFVVTFIGFYTYYFIIIIIIIIIVICIIVIIFIIIINM